MGSITRDAALWTAVIVVVPLAAATIADGIWALHPPILGWYLSLFTWWAALLGAS